MTVPPVIFLPGSLCDARLFDAALDALGPPATCIDYGTASSIEEMAAVVLDSAPEQFVAVGLSMGAIVAVEIAHKAPERVTGLILLDTNLGTAPPEQVETRRRWEQMSRAGQFSEVVRELVPLLTADIIRHGDVVSTMALAAGPDVFLAQNRAIIDRRDRLDDLFALSCPVLIGCGANDTMCPPAIHREIAQRVPSATFVVFDDSGHLSPIDQPATVTESLLEWLETNQENNPRRGNQ